MSQISTKNCITLELYYECRDATIKNYIIQEEILQIVHELEIF